MWLPRLTQSNIGLPDIECIDPANKHAWGVIWKVTSSIFWKSACFSRLCFSMLACVVHGLWLYFGSKISHVLITINRTWFMFELWKSLGCIWILHLTNYICLKLYFGQILVSLVTSNCLLTTHFCETGKPTEACLWAFTTIQRLFFIVIFPAKPALCLIRPVYFIWQWSGPIEEAWLRCKQTNHPYTVGKHKLYIYVGKVFLFQFRLVPTYCAVIG